MKRHAMPDHQTIYDYWARNIMERGHVARMEDLSDTIDEPLKCVCFACGNPFSKLQRAHILPICDGGSNDVSNIHVLCAACHDASEAISGDRYWFWFDHVEFMSWDYWLEKRCCIRAGCRTYEEFAALCFKMFRDHGGDADAAHRKMMDILVNARGVPTSS